MSGVEALGLACNIFQVISFARETITACQAIYRGQKTQDDALEENTAAMIEAARAIQTRPLAGGPAEKKLNEIAQSCSEAGLRLEREVRKITVLQKKGSVFAAFSSRLRSVWKKSQIEELDASLCRYKQTLKTLLISDLCDQGRARDLRLNGGFGQLDDRLQRLIRAIEDGHKDLGNALRLEGKATRDHITQQTQQTGESIKAHVVSEIHEERSKAEQQRLLQSLKFPRMNERLNEIMDPESATLTRIFRAFENAVSPTQSVASSRDIERYKNTFRKYENTEEVDETWQGFMSWLESDGPIFWIQGKPGAGKSTLMKSIIQHDATQRLLARWRPDVRIVSHFFWMLGSAKIHMNAKGLYLSLLFQTFQKRPELLDSFVPGDLLPDKHSDADWSTEELRKIIFAVLGSEQGEPLCLFLDGIDEYRDEDDFSGLMNRVIELSKFSGVKVCLASRPEVVMQKRLDGLPHLKLHELTWPEMRRWTYLQFESFGGVEDTMEMDKLIYDLLDKAQGVFLWLRLAVRSLRSGFEKEDSHNDLRQRINELPDELDDLYADMWGRLNRDTRQYRASAALYFRLVITFNQREATYVNVRSGRQFSVTSSRPYDVYYEARDLTLLEILCIKNSQMRRKILDLQETVHHEELGSKCRRIQQEINTQTAGMIELRDFEMKRYLHTGDTDIEFMTTGVAFIHRTAQDFLCDTEKGQEILSHYKYDPSSVHIKSIEAFLGLARLLWNDFSMCSTSSTVFLSLVTTWKSMRQDNDACRERLLRVVKNIVQFHNLGIILDRSRRYSQLHILAQMAETWTWDDSDFTRSLLAVLVPQNPEWALRDLLSQQYFSILDPMDRHIRAGTESSIGLLLEKLRGLGADPNSIGYSRWYRGAGPFCIRRTSGLWELASVICFESLVGNCPWNDLWELPLHSVGREFVYTLRESSPEALDRKGFVRIIPECYDTQPRLGQSGHGRLSVFPGWAESRPSVVPMFETSLRFFADATLARLENAGVVEASGVREESESEDLPSVPFIILDKSGSLRWYRYDRQLLPTSPLLSAFARRSIGMKQRFAEGHDAEWKREFHTWQDEIWELCKAGSLQEVDAEEVFKSHPNHLGPCTMESAGLVWSKKVFDYVDEATAAELGPSSAVSSIRASSSCEGSRFFLSDSSSEDSDHNSDTSSSA